MSTPKTEPISPRDRQAVLAFAEAILPGSERIYAADESTVDRAFELLEELPGPASLGFAKAVRTLDGAAAAWKGKAFSQLSRAQQEDLLRRWPDNPVMAGPLALLSHVLKMCHFDADPVYETLGGKFSLDVTPEQPPWLEQINDASELGEEEVECDVVVVGTGAGGAVVGRELAARGHAVLFVEKGQRFGRESFDGRSLPAHKKFYRPAITLGNPPTPIMMGEMLGGSTAINGGSCYRTPTHVLERWCEDLGTDAFSVERMRPHFERVEQTIQVAPAPKNTVGPIQDVIARGCDALGYSHFTVLRNAPGCDGSGFCDFGCRTGAKQSTDVSYIPKAIKSGAMVLTGLRADRVIIESGRAVGVQCTALESGRTVRVRARRVVLACGAIHTPAFLLRQGIANRSGQVGRHLSIQPSTGFAALMDQDIHGPSYTPQGYGVSEFIRQGILIAAGLPDYNFAGTIFALHGQRLMDAVDRIDQTASFALLSQDTSAPGRVRLGPGGRTLVSYSLADDDLERLHRAMVIAADICLAAGARRLYPQLPGLPLLEGPGALETLRDAKLRASDLQLIAYHPAGTCQIGHDPDHSVVDFAHECHDVPGLHVVDGSTVPGPPAVNPQVTIMAMATRAAGLIAERLGG